MRSVRQLPPAQRQWSTCDWSATDFLAIALPQPRERQDAERRQALLAQTIEADIIPRLMLAHTGLSPPQTAKKKPRAYAPDRDDAIEFARLTLEHDETVAAAFVEALLAKGATLEGVFLDLMAPAARRLGDLWIADICDFTEVTIALSKMQRLLRDLSPAFEEEGDVRQSLRRVLLAPVPGDQHSFGLFMVEGFFRRAGWDVVSCSAQNKDEICDLIRAEQFDLVGLSASCDAVLDEVKSLIATIRSVSRNNAVAVMVGGRFFIDNPDYVTLVGADATAKDGRHAIMQIPSLFALKT